MGHPVLFRVVRSHPPCKMSIGIRQLCVRRTSPLKPKNGLSGPPAPEPGRRRPQPLKFLIVLPQLGKSKSPPCRRKRDKGGAPSGVEMRERVGQPSAKFLPIAYDGKLHSYAGAEWLRRNRRTESKYWKRGSGWTGSIMYSRTAGQNVRGGSCNNWRCMRGVRLDRGSLRAAVFAFGAGIESVSPQRRRVRGEERKLSS